MDHKPNPRDHIRPTRYPAPLPRGEGISAETPSQQGDVQPVGYGQLDKGGVQQ